MNLLMSRRLPAIIGLFGMGLLAVPIAFIGDPYIALALISASIFCGQVAGTAGWVLVTAVAPQTSIASLASLQNCGGYVGAALAPAVTGFLLQQTGSFGPGLLVGAVVALLSACSYLFLTTLPVQADHPEGSSAIQPAPSA
jgi:cyanate permease